MIRRRDPMLDTGVCRKVSIVMGVVGGLFKKVEKIWKEKKPEK